MRSIQQFVQRFKMKKIPLHVLVNNGEFWWNPEVNSDTDTSSSGPLGKRDSQGNVCFSYCHCFVPLMCLAFVIRIINFRMLLWNDVQCDDVSCGFDTLTGPLGLRCMRDMQRVGCFHKGYFIKASVCFHDDHDLGSRPSRPAVSWRHPYNQHSSNVHVGSASPLPPPSTCPLATFNTDHPEPCCRPCWALRSIGNTSAFSLSCPFPRLSLSLPLLQSTCFIKVHPNSPKRNTVINISKQ